MGRGTNLAEGISLVDSSPSGVHRIIHFRGDTMVIQKQQDMEPVLQHVREMRERNAGKNWGEGREVGHIPDLFYGKISMIVDRNERQKAVKQFFRENPAFCAYDAFLKD